MTSDSSARSKISSSNTQMDSQHPSENSNEHDSVENAVQRAFDQTLNSQELNFIDNVLADKNRTCDEKNSQPTTNDVLTEALATLNLGNGDSSNHVSSSQIQESAVIEKPTSTTDKKPNDPIEARSPDNIPSGTKPQPQPANDLCTIFEQNLTIAASNEKSSTETSVQELSISPNDKTWKNLNEIGTYKVFTYAIKFKGMMHPYVAISAQKENTDSKISYRLKGSSGSNFHRYFNNQNLLEKEGYLVTFDNPLKIIRLASGNPFAEFKITHDEECPKLKNVVFYADSAKYFEEIFGPDERKPSDLVPEQNQKKDDQATRPEPEPPLAHSSKHSEKITNKKPVSKKKETKAPPVAEPRTSVLTPGEISNFSQEKTWKEFKIGGSFEIFAYTVKLKRNIPQMAVLVRQEKVDGRRVYHFNGSYARQFKAFFDEPELLEKGEYFISTHNRLKIMYRKSGDPFAKFTVNGTEIFEGKKCPKFEDFEFYTNSWYNHERIFRMTKETLSEMFLWDNWFERNFNLESEYTIYAFTVDKVTEHSAVGVLASEKNSNSKQVYIFKGRGKKEFEDRFNHWHKFPKQDYGVITCNNWSVMYLTSEEPLAELKTAGIFTYKGCSFPNVAYLHFFKDHYSKDLIFGESWENRSNSFKLDNWQWLDKTGNYEVYALTVIERENYPYVGVFAKEKNTNSEGVFQIEGKAEDGFRLLFNARTEGLRDCEVIKLNDSDVMVSAKKQLIATFKTNGLCFEKGRRFPKIDELEFVNWNLN